MRSCCVVGVLAFVGACSGGGSTSGVIDGGAGDSSGGSSGGGGPCPALHLGGTNDASIGGGATSQVTAQAVSDLSGATDTQTTDVTAACKGIATTLDAPA